MTSSKRSATPPPDPESRGGGDGAEGPSEAESIAPSPSPPVVPSPDEGLIVGELVGPHGILGEVKLYPITDFPERLARYRRLVLALPDGTRRPVRVQRARPHKNVWLLKLRDANTPEAAEALRGAKVIVPPELAAPLPEGHFYLHDVVGLRAVTADGEELGTVTDVLRSPANDIYVVGELLIPAVREIVDRIDPAEGVLVVRSGEALATEEVPPDNSEGESRSRGAGTRPPRKIGIRRRPESPD